MGEMFLVYNGLRTYSGETPDSGHRPLPPDLGLSPDSLPVSYVANLREDKGHLCLLEAARRVVEAVPFARFLLADERTGKRPLSAKKSGNSDSMGTSCWYKAGYPRDPSGDTGRRTPWRAGRDVQRNSGSDGRRSSRSGLQRGGKPRGSGGRENGITRATRRSGRPCVRDSRSSSRPGPCRQDGPGGAGRDPEPVFPLRHGQRYRGKLHRVARGQTPLPSGMIKPSAMAPLKITYVLPNVESGGRSGTSSTWCGGSTARFSLSMVTVAGGGSLYDDFAERMPVTVLGEPARGQRVPQGLLRAAGDAGVVTACSGPGSRTSCTPTSRRERARAARGASCGRAPGDRQQTGVGGVQGDSIRCCGGSSRWGTAWPTSSS